MNRVAPPMLVRPLVLVHAASCALVLLAASGCDNPAIGRLAAIEVTPNVVVFTNATPRAEPHEEFVTISNVGQTNVTVTKLEIRGDSQFELAPDTEATRTLRPDEDWDVRILYSAIDLESRRAELRVSSTAPSPGNLPIVVPIRTDDLAPRIVVTDCVRGAAGGDGGAGGACLTPVDDLVVDFGEMRPTQCKTGEVIIDNTGNVDLEIQPPVFQAGSSTDISFDGAAPSDIRVDKVNASNVPGRQVIKVKYCASSTTEASAELLLQSNDPQNSQVIVRLIGRAANNGSPTCVCNPSTLEVAPQDTVNLTANCTDPDNQPLQYAWTVERRPAGSTEQIRNANSRNASFTANTATTANEPYVFRVTATDTFGTSGTCSITVHAVPRDALHIQLVWDTDQTDVDLHFLNPPGTANPFATTTGYFSSPNDCYFADRTPDWGVAGNTQDNPRLDLDDTTGFGPENINLGRPMSGTYEVGVHYYCDDSLGASRATVRIFCNGQLANEYGPKSLPATGFFWQVARIQWPGCTITEVDQTRTVTQGCLGFGF